MNFLHIKSMFLVEDFKTATVKFQNQGADLEVIKDYIDRFKKLKDVKIKKPEEKNIDLWAKKSFDEFKDFIDTKEQETTKTQQKKQQKTEGAELIAENEDWYVYKITSHKAAQIYGKGTKWCITEPDCAYWDEYTQHSNFYFFISKNRTQEDPWYKIAFQHSSEDGELYWDAEDTQHTKLPDELNIPDFWSKLEAPPTSQKIIINGSEESINDMEYIDQLGGDVEVDFQNANPSIPGGITIEGNLTLDGGAEPLTITGTLKVKGDLLLQNNLAVDEMHHIYCDGKVELESFGLRETQIITNIEAQELDTVSTQFIGEISKVKVQALSINDCNINILKNCECDFLNIGKTSIDEIENVRVKKGLMMSEGEVPEGIILEPGAKITKSGSEDESKDYPLNKSMFVEDKQTMWGDKEFLASMMGYFDSMKGGAADKLKPSDFNFNDLHKGWKEEREHTEDPILALEIAMDHLAKDKDAYSDEKLDEAKKKKKKKKRNRSPYFSQWIELLDKFYGPEGGPSAATHPPYKPTLNQYNPPASTSPAYPGAGGINSPSVPPGTNTGMGPV